MDTMPYALSDSGESSSDHGSSSSRSRRPSPSPSLLERYNAAISARLDLSSTASPSSHVVPKVAEDDADDDAGPGSRPMTKAEKQKAKNKRRKEREKAIRAQGASINVPTTAIMRLFSSQAAKPVSLVRPSQHYDLTANPRHLPLPPDVVDRIAIVASEASHSAAARGTWDAFKQDDSRRAKRVRLVSLDRPSSDLPSTAMMRISSRSTSTHENVSEPADDTNRVPILPVVDPTLVSRRPRRKRKQHVRAPPAYYRPSSSLGGKSAGYAYGY